MSDRVSVSISRELYERAAAFVREQGGFESVEELIEFLLQEVLSGSEGERGLSEEEEAEVKERLRSLGYL